MGFGINYNGFIYSTAHKLSTKAGAIKSYRSVWNYGNLGYVTQSNYRPYTHGQEVKTWQRLAGVLLYAKACFYGKSHYYIIQKDRLKRRLTVWLNNSATLCHSRPLFRWTCQLLRFPSGDSLFREMHSRIISAC